MKIIKDENERIRKIEFEKDDVYRNILNPKALLRDMPPDTTFYNTELCLPNIDDSTYTILNLGIINTPYQVGAIEKDKRFSNCFITYNNTDNLNFCECDFTEFRMNPILTSNNKIFYVSEVEDSRFVDSTIIYTQPITSTDEHKSLKEFFIDFENNSVMGTVTIHANYNGLWQNITFL